MVPEMTTSNTDQWENFFGDPQTRELVVRNNVMILYMEEEQRDRREICQLFLLLSAGLVEYLRGT